LGASSDPEFAKRKADDFMGAARAVERAKGPDDNLQLTIGQANRQLIKIRNVDDTLQWLSNLSRRWLQSGPPFP